MNQVTPYGTMTYSRPNATTGALAGNTGGGMTTTQGMGTGTPNTSPGSTQSIYKAEGGNSYRNMNTGALEQFDTPPGQDNGSGIFYGGLGGTPASTSAKPASSDPGAYDPNDVWQSTITLSPEGQRQFDLQNQLNESIGGLAFRNFGNVESAQSQPFSLGGLGAAPQFSLDGLPDAPVADDATRQRVEQALFDQARSRLDPMRDQREAQIRERLSSQGIPINSEAYGREFETFNRGQNDLYAQALANAIVGGGQEQSRLFGLGSAARSNAVNERQLAFGNNTTARQNAIQEMLLQRNQPINELAALLGTSPGVQSPQFTPAGATGVAPTDITGLTNAQYQGQLNGYNQQQATSASNKGGLIGLGGTLGAGALMAPQGSWFSNLMR